jgi:hypothetical protein
MQPMDAGEPAAFQNPFAYTRSIAMAHTQPTHTRPHAAKAKAAKPPAATRPAAVASAHAVMVESLPAPQPHELLKGPTREDMIRLRAYDIYERNGRVDGRDVDDWLRAEAEIARKTPAGAPPRRPARQDSAMA